RGADEAQASGHPKAAAEMVLIRLAYASDLPPPDHVLRALGGATAVTAGSGGALGGADASGADGGAPVQRASGSSGSLGPAGAAHSARASSGGAVGSAAPAAVPTAQANVTPMLETFDAVIAFVGEKRDAKLKLALEDCVSLVRFEPGRIEVALLDGAPRTLAGELGEKLTRWTHSRWVVTVSRAAGAKPVGAVRRQREADAMARLEQHPAVRAVLEGMPGAKIDAVRPIARPADDAVAPESDAGGEGFDGADGLQDRDDDAAV
ncbi:MAG: DNA polymerase III subunit gamma/tau, partial [Pseudomonadota bacterium]